MMVLFANINVNQRVEILRAGRVYSGTVKYKGTVNGESGDWVGIALDTPDGMHDGMLYGRRYFLCPNKHGIFTTASQIRFVPLRRSLRDPYRTVDQTSLVEENLFTSNAEWPDALSLEKERLESYVDSGYCNAVLSSKHYDMLVRRDRPRRHPVGSRFPTAIMLRPDLEHSKCFGTSSSPSRSPVRAEYQDDGLDFIHPPTIPKPHIPHSALKRQVNRGWNDTHYAREMTVCTGRDAIKYRQWNDTSA